MSAPQQPPKPAKPPTRWPVIFGVLLLNLLVVAVTLLHLREARSDFEDDARASVQNLSLLLERDIGGSFDKIDLALQDLVETHALLGRNLISGQEWTAFLLRHRERLPMLSALRATNAHGDVIYGLDPDSPVGASVADRDYFIRLRDNPQAGLVMTRPLYGRTTQTQVIALARRLATADGRFDGVIYAVIPLERFIQIFERLRLGKLGSIAFRDGDLSLIARHPALPGNGDVGSTVVSDDFTASLAVAPNEGLYVAGTTSTDGIRRLHSYRRDVTYNFIVNVGSAEDDYLRSWYFHVGRVAAFLLVFVAVSVLVVLRVLGLFKAQFEALEQLRHSEGKFRLMFEGTADALLLLDPERPAFIDCNQATVDMLRLEAKQDCLPLHPAVLSPELQPDGRTSMEKAGEMIAIALRNGSHRFEWVHCSTRRENFPVEVLLTPIQLEGRLLILTTWRDISERKEAEQKLLAMNERLERSNNELESFAYVAAHDLREPLRNVTSFSSLLERRLGERLDGEQREFLQIIKDAAFRMDALVGDLLGLSQVGRSETELTDVPVADVIDQALQSLQTRISESGAKITVDPMLPVLRGNRNELYQVFLNLIVNAIKYSRQGEPILIHIHCAQEAEYWHFLVRDNRIGIETGCGYEERVFKLFQRLHQRNEFGGGTGVGLAICRKAIERHGGRIWVESEGLGQGSTFHVILPKT